MESTMKNNELPCSTFIFNLDTIKTFKVICYTREFVFDKDKIFDVLLQLENKTIER